jgi:hypothetical protein
MALVIAGLSSLVSGALKRRLGGASSSGAARAVTVAVAALAMAVPVVNSARYLPTAPAFAPNGGNALEELRGHLAGRGDLGGSVWTDWETRRILPAFMRPTFGGDRVWSAPTRSLTGAGAPKVGDYVLYYSAKDNTCDHCRTALAPALREQPTPPDNWELEFATDTRNLLLYRVH